MCTRPSGVLRQTVPAALLSAWVEEIWLAVIAESAAVGSSVFADEHWSTFRCETKVEEVRDSLLRREASLARRRCTSGIPQNIAGDQGPLKDESVAEQ